MTLGGCQSQPKSPLPQYALTDPQQTLAAYLAHRAQPRTVRTQATIELTDPHQQTVHLDAALLMQAPDRIRLRAWKFGTAVFDLAVQGQQAWAYTPRDEARPAVPMARKSIVQWMSLIEGNITTSQSQLNQTADELIVETPTEGGMIRSVIDRHTLTATRHEFVDQDGKTRFTLRLTDYHPQPDGQLWPMAIEAISEQGKVAIRFNDVSFNEPLPADLFNPPPRAVALP